MDLYRWSKTAASNNAAVPDGAPEGWTGANVNEVVREIMAAARRQYEDSAYLEVTYQLTSVGVKSLTRTSGSQIDLLACNGASYFSAGRRIKIVGDTTGYGYVTSSSFVTPNTEIIVSMEAGDVPTNPTGIFVASDAVMKSGAWCVWSTGDIKLTLKNAADSGWVLFDDGSIGGASSGATSRAAQDTYALFVLIWTNVSNTWAPMQDSSGTPTARGGSPASDFGANRRLVLPKALGRALAIAGTGDTLTARALGETLGAETVTLTSNEMPAHTHTIGSHPSDGSAAASVQNSDQPAAANTLLTNSTGGGAAHANMQPSVFLNAMVKL